MEDGLSVARQVCRRLGYEVTGEGTGPPAGLARPGEDATPVPGIGPDGDRARPVEVSVVGDPAPYRVVSALGRAVEADRACLLVPGRGVGTGDLRSVLDPPLGARSEGPDGRRTLFAGPDRVHVDGGGLAAVDAGSPARPAVRWVESGGPSTDDDRSGGLVLSVDGETVATLDGRSLCRPAPETFPLRYRRGDDRRFRVFDRDGREVGVFGGVRAMRDRGIHPVPAPLVPERHLPGSATSSWAVLDPGRRRLYGPGGPLDPE